MAEMLIAANERARALLWGPLGVGLLLFTGLFLSVQSGFFQLVHLPLWLKSTLGTLLAGRQPQQAAGKGGISAFQSLCTALAATIGTGSVVGVATALYSGGPGALFWMWVMAFLGMMCAYAENLLALRYRRRGAAGWQGGPMYYLSAGLGARPGCRRLGRALGAAYALLCVLASFGVGNLSQVNVIANSLESAFGLPAAVSGAAVAAVTGWLLWRGLGSVAALAERLVPFMALFYLGGALLVVLTHAAALPAALGAVFRGAFGLRAAGGGVVGYGMAAALRWGFMRGSFSNEAGLGSSAIAGAAANTREPVQQGMWGIFQVFVSTFLVCTMTALAILCAGLFDLESGRPCTDTAAEGLAGAAFSASFGPLGPAFLAGALLLFAWSSVLGWSQYGAAAWGYLFGARPVRLYRLAFTALLFVGANAQLDTLLAFSDTFNGLMMLPNLAGLLALSGEVERETQRYLRAQRGPKRALPAQEKNAPPESG